MNQNLTDPAVKKTPAWMKLRLRAHKALYAPKSERKLHAIYERLSAFIEDEKKGYNRPQIRIMHALAHWRVTGQFEAGYKSLNEARLQLWELEKFCPVFEFQKLFLAKIARDYPNTRGPNNSLQIYNQVGEVAYDDFDDPTQDIVIFRRPGATKTVIGFSGHAMNISGTGWTMFDRAVTQKLNANLIILRDFKRLYYLTRIRSIGTLDQTISYLSDLLEEFKDTTITATGGSGGVFGAFLLSSALGIKHVVASSGPTSLDIGFDDGDRQRFLTLQKMIDRGEVTYQDLLEQIKASDIQHVDFFVAGRNEFDLAQMKHLSENTDIVTEHVYAKEELHSILALAILDGSFAKAIGREI